MRFSTNEQFAVLSDAISASHGSLGVCAVYANGLKVLLRENITIAEFDRVAREHRDLFKQLGRKVAWYEQICD